MKDAKIETKSEIKTFRQITQFSNLSLEMEGNSNGSLSLVITQGEHRIYFDRDIWENIKYYIDESLKTTDAYLL